MVMCLRVSLDLDAPASAQNVNWTVRPMTRGGSGALSDGHHTCRRGPTARHQPLSKRVAKDFTPVTRGHRISTPFAHPSSLAPSRWRMQVYSGDGSVRRQPRDDEPQRKPPAEKAPPHVRPRRSAAVGRPRQRAAGTAASPGFRGARAASNRPRRSADAASRCGASSCGRWAARTASIRRFWRRTSSNWHPQALEWPSRHRDRWTSTPEMPLSAPTTVEIGHSNAPLGTDSGQNRAFECPFGAANGRNRAFTRPRSTAGGQGRALECPWVTAIGQDRAFECPPATANGQDRAFEWPGGRCFGSYLVGGVGAIGEVAPGATGSASVASSSRAVLPRRALRPVWRAGAKVSASSSAQRR